MWTFKTNILHNAHPQKHLKYIRFRKVTVRQCRLRCRRRRRRGAHPMMPVAAVAAVVG